jgi:hypothetical protein
MGADPVPMNSTLPPRTAFTFGSMILFQLVSRQANETSIHAHLVEDESVPEGVLQRSRGLVVGKFRLVGPSDESTCAAGPSDELQSRLLYFPVVQITFKPGRIECLTLRNVTARSERKPHEGPRGAAFAHLDNLVDPVQHTWNSGESLLR